MTHQHGIRQHGARLNGPIRLLLSKAQKEKVSVRLISFKNRHKSRRDNLHISRLNTNLS